jgi:hypothetical protein
MLNSGSFSGLEAGPHAEVLAGRPPIRRSSAAPIPSPSPGPHPDPGLAPGPEFPPQDFEH